MTNHENIIQTIEYKGRTITIRGIQYSEGGTVYPIAYVGEAKVTDAREGATEAKAIASAKRWIDTDEFDANIRWDLTKIIGTVDADDARWVTNDTPAATLEVGNMAAVYAMGRNRIGLVTKIGKTNVTVSYTTASSGGRIFHKSVGTVRVPADTIAAPAESSSTPDATVATDSTTTEEVTMSTDTTTDTTPAAKAASTRRGTIAVDYPEYAKALDLKDNGKRGPGVKISDSDLQNYCLKVIAQRPTYGANRELEIAYWVEKLAVTRTRFIAAYNQALGGGAEPTVLATGSSAEVPSGSDKAPAPTKAANARKSKAELKEGIEARAEARRAKAAEKDVSTFPKPTAKRTRKAPAAKATDTAKAS